MKFTNNGIWNDDGSGADDDDDGGCGDDDRGGDDDDDRIEHPRSSYILAQNS